MDDAAPPFTSVVFVELAGADARGRLDALGRRLREGGAEVELLVSADRPELYLLMCRGAVAPPHGLPNGLPEEARVWRFTAAPPTSPGPSGR